MCVSSLTDIMLRCGNVMSLNVGSEHDGRLTSPFLFMLSHLELK